MAKAGESPRSPRSRERDIAWEAVGSGFGVAFLGTLAAAIWAFGIAAKGTWWAAHAGTLFLLAGGALAGYRAATPEPLNGAYLALLYFGTATLAIFVGEFLGVLPDPLPGLPRGDSTFYFVWPLEQLAAATLGAVLGGRLARER